MKNKKNNKTAYILSLIAATCFFLTYLLTKETLNFTLSIAWLIIGFYYLEEYKKKKNS